MTGDLSSLRAQRSNLAASGEAVLERLAGGLGASEFITKPVDFDRLKAQLPAAAD
jgi:hypothetical protein